MILHILLRCKLQAADCDLWASRYFESHLAQYQRLVWVRRKENGIRAAFNRVNFMRDFMGPNPTCVLVQAL